MKSHGLSTVIREWRLSRCASESEYRPTTDEVVGVKPGTSFLPGSPKRFARSSTTRFAFWTKRTTTTHPQPAHRATQMGGHSHAA